MAFKNILGMGYGTAKRPSKEQAKRTHCWAIYHIKGTPAKLIGIIDNMPDEKAKVGRPVTVRNGYRLNVRLPTDLTRQVEAYAARNKDRPLHCGARAIGAGLKGEVQRPMLAGYNGRMAKRPTGKSPS